MDKVEAQRVLENELGQFRCKSHGELVPLVEARRVDAYERAGPSGTTYQIEIQFVWDNKRGGGIRVLGFVDDGGIRAYFPLGRDFLVYPE